MKLLQYWLVDRFIRISFCTSFRSYALVSRVSWRRTAFVYQVPIGRFLCNLVLETTLIWTWRPLQNVAKILIRVKFGTSPEVLTELIDDGIEIPIVSWPFLTRDYLWRTRQLKSISLFIRRHTWRIQDGTHRSLWNPLSRACSFGIFLLERVSHIPRFCHR